MQHVRALIKSFFMISILTVFFSADGATSMLNLPLNPNFKAPNRWRQAMTPVVIADNPRPSLCARYCIGGGTYHVYREYRFTLLKLHLPRVMALPFRARSHVYPRR
jgi:hypothetical protein